MNCLKGLQNDVRTIDKLFNGRNRTFDDRNVWLAPLVTAGEDAPASEFRHNTIFVGFERMVVLGCVNFWNYTKTPSRGAREVELFLDDNLIYKVSRGTLG